MIGPYDYRKTLGPTPTPGLDEFRILAQDRRVIPVVRRVLLDGMTAVGVYRALAGSRAGTFLFESAEVGGVWSRYSFVGVRAAAMLTERDGQTRWVGPVPIGLPTDGSVLEVLRESVAALHTERFPDLPPLTGGFVGYVGYDAVRQFERLPDNNLDEIGTPDVVQLLATDLAVLDHQDGSVLLVANAINYDNTDQRIDDAWHDAVGRVDAMVRTLSVSASATPQRYDTEAQVTPIARTTAADYCTGVERVRDYIEAGDAFQVVVSQRFSVPCAADPLDVYRILRITNPSPYMYLLRIPRPDGDELGSDVWFDIVGSSPEALVKVAGRQVLVHPIAGSRPRGATPDADAALAEELLADPKERAEHLMLVDLGRNDVGRVCDPGSVEVVDFMTVERFSHIMHISSTVLGTLRTDALAFDALRAAFPAGTLSGAPKVRAMEIIDELEPVRRGIYGGAIGYFDFAGDLDTAIAIRTAVVIDGTAYVQAGAGLVADSIPELEHAECEAKAAALMRAIAVACSIVDLP